MKFFLKILSAVLSFILLISAMAGCGGKSVSSETESLTESKTEGNTESETEKETEPNPDSKLHSSIKSGNKLVSKSELIASLSTPDDISTGKQGGYTDEKYHYQLFIKKDKDSNEKNNIDRLVKYDMEKKETVAVSGILDLNHANDLTYNAKENVFVAVHNNPNRTKVSKISPESLEIIETIDIGIEIYCISYNEATDRYVVGLSGGQDFRILNSEFKPISKIHRATSLTKGYTTQGVSSDNEYIYFVLYKENVITVYDWNGNFASLIYLDFLGEPENISIVGEDIYVAAASDGKAAIYKLNSLEKFTISPIRSQNNKPTPELDSGNHLTDYFSDDGILAYLPLDGNETDAIGKSDTSAKKTVNYVNGIYGKAASLNKGYISVSDFHPATSNFTMSFWIKTYKTSGDPAIASNKDWDSGKNPGFIVALTHNSVIFNMGNEERSENMKLYYPLPFDYDRGWMHVIVSVNRDAGTVGVSYDFNDFIVTNVTETMKNVSLDAFEDLSIGQDGTGNYPDSLPATLDEFIIFNKAFTSDDISKLAAYYGIKSEPNI